MQCPESVTLSAQEGEAMIERLAACAPSVADCQGLMHVLRWHCWLVCAVQEATRSLKRLRSVLCGKASPSPALPETASAAPQPDGQGSGAGEAAFDAEARRADAGRGAADSAVPSTPAGGHRRGMGRLGAAASAGAERVECRHEELRGGQRCPGCGQGTL